MFYLSSSLPIFLFYPPSPFTILTASHIGWFYPSTNITCLPIICLCCFTCLPVLPMANPINFIRFLCNLSTLLESWTDNPSIICFWSFHFSISLPTMSGCQVPLFHIGSNLRSGGCAATLRHAYKHNHNNKSQLFLGPASPPMLSTSPGLAAPFSPSHQDYCCHICHTIFVLTGAIFQSYKLLFAKFKFGHITNRITICFCGFL